LNDSRDFAALRLEANPPDVLVGCAAQLQAAQLSWTSGGSTPALLLARPEDSSFLRAFMKSHPNNDFAMLPQSEVSLRSCVANFLRQHHQRRRLQCSSSFGDYLLIRDTSQVVFGKNAVMLSPFRFALAQALFMNADAQISDNELFQLISTSQRMDVRRLIDSNLALLTRVLEFNGKHGYSLVRCSQGIYCLNSIRQ